MTSQTSNPLAQYFRKPTIYITLPSGGKYYPPNSLEQNESGEIPVYPMTAIDEISYRTPDALFNGNATVDVIKSCIPAIKDPWSMPAIDFDTVLIGIRIASYGSKMEITSVCPHCTNENTFDVDLKYVLGGIEPANFNDPIVIDEHLTIFLKPLTYKEIVKNQVEQLNNQRDIENMTSTGMKDSEISDKIREVIKKLSLLTAQSIANSISYMVLDGTRVTDRQHIDEFIRNADKTMFGKIKDHLVTIKEKTEIKPLTITCQNHECLKKYETPFTMDVANFFV